MADGEGRRTSAARSVKGLPIMAVLLIGVGALITVAVAMVFAAGYEVAQTNTNELVRDKATLITDAIIDRIQNHLDPARSLVEFVVARIVAMGIDPLDDKTIGALLSASLAGVPQVSVIAFVGPNFRVLRAFRNRPNTPVTASDWSDDPEFRQAAARDKTLTGATWGKLFYAESIDRTLLNIRMPVRAKGIFLGSVVAAVSIEELSAALSEGDNDEPRHAFVLYDHDHVLAHPMMANGYPGLSDAKPLPTLDNIADPVLRRIWFPGRQLDIEAALAGKVDSRAVAHDGETHVFLFQKLPGYGPEPWIVGTYFNYRDIAAQVGRIGLIPRLALAVLAAALIVTFMLSRALSRPAKQLAAVAERVRDLDLEDIAPLPQGPFREFNEAAQAFDAMVRGLDWFLIYVPRFLVRHLLSQGDGARMVSDEREVTVLFTDIAGFTALAADLSPTETADFLNHHFTLIGVCVERNGGIIDKYIGDSLMAFWSAASDDLDHAGHSNHAARACRAAAMIADAIDTDNRDRVRRGLAPVGVRIGVHSGLALVGNIGAPGRINYTITGNTVNIAERIEARERADGDTDKVVIYVSGETAGLAGPDFRFEPRGQFRPRGQQRLFEIYRLSTAQSTASIK